ncbi:hypothetical protein T4D_16510 [Trichinella pseudospiralis]|uniref:Uncharacterized protein n=1 Tax=Trichinella pseudospiralis TaxID=6337 RepID=A0A0V1FGT2_TRIPS|nr:hypothetical protein T4D_16510 [Trichinella pseudospiralis]
MMSKPQILQIIISIFWVSRLTNTSEKKKISFEYSNKLISPKKSPTSFDSMYYYWRCHDSKTANKKQQLKIAEL